MKQYRLIWFQHFHKAGGTSIVELARANGETFYRNNANGNPLDANGKVIPLWQYNDQQISSFVDHCQHAGVTFVATEWGCPNFEHLSQDGRVVTLTCMREPFSRILSSYYFVINSGYVLSRVRLFEYYESHFFVALQPNYYVKELAMGTGLSKCAGPDALDAARRNFDAIDHCAILEGNRPFQSIAGSLGWTRTEAHYNTRARAARRLAGAIRRGRLRVALNVIWLKAIYRMRNLQNFQRHFESLNGSDLHLFEYARERAAQTSGLLEACD